MASIESANGSPGMKKSALSGVRVLDFSHILAGPFCTRLLADFGADVVKVETRTRQDRMGAIKPGERLKGRSDRPPAYLTTNRNKRSITINLKTDEGKNLALQLAGKAESQIFSLIGFQV